MSLLISDFHYCDIPFDCMADKGGIVVCKDTQDRLGENKTWAVVKTHSNKEAPPDAYALFWEKERAIEYATFLNFLGV